MARKRAKKKRVSTPGAGAFRAGSIFVPTGLSAAFRPQKVGRSKKAKRKAARKVAAGPREVAALRAELGGAPLPRAYWAGEAGKARRAGSRRRARGYLRTGRDPLESVIPKLP